ncbi:hypothetical protein [Dyadobacter fanqingshengii]|uniref:Uncharacterized protein n=1 Tax=Dyadobacter fanqingshengii TaxID=2906443 RepID=A0A9X1PDA0_9BACT|nr:hypothetical protein [Dyadobacter fanqingshengii]MCF0041127.1 hypothetical protein [Dyadobacter fanqingshengii]USJ37146.1 hypothetical protein NFI81_05065 [Dyadobacter fanqingshengii]
MHNEKLFNKIKDLALNDHPDDEKWDAEEVWGKIKQKDKRRSRWIWYLLPAAASVLIAIFWMWPNDKKEMSVVKESIENVEKQRTVQTHSDKHLSVVKEVEEKPKVRPHRATVQRVEIMKEPILEIEAATVNDQMFGVNPEKMFENNPELVAQANPDSLALTETKPTLPVKERVLTAEIELPGRQEEIPLTALQIMFKKAKEERETRRLRTRYIDNDKAFWSFVRHSFVENPTVVAPDNPSKQH